MLKHGKNKQVRLSKSWPGTSYLNWTALTFNLPLPGSLLCQQDSLQGPLHTSLSHLKEKKKDYLHPPKQSKHLEMTGF